MKRIVQEPRELAGTGSAGETVAVPWPSDAAKGFASASRKS
ncbi:MAG TPA: hypothetical protein VFG80_11220 [Myxococcota bacterium]|nr:hypothetical protein [Myxococcota bacterium]